MLKLTIGTMRSGKSTMLLNEYRKLKESNKKVIIVKHSTDNRIFFARNVFNDFLIYHKENILFNDLINEYDYILIDEIQFFNDKELDKIIELSAKKNIFCYGLSSKAIDESEKIEIWSSVARLIPYAESIEKLNAYCDYCKETALIHIRNSKETIGDDYTVCCLSCYEKLKY